MQIRNGPAAVTERIKRAFPFVGHCRLWADARSTRRPEELDARKSEDLPAHTIATSIARDNRTPYDRSRLASLRRRRLERTSRLRPVKRRNTQAAKPVAQLSMSTASHDRCRPAHLECTDDTSVLAGAIVSTTARKPAAKVEIPGASDYPAISVAEAHRFSRRRWRSRAVGAGSTSIVLHAGVLLAAWQVLAPSAAHWELHLERGRSSVSLQASIAASPSSMREPDIRVPPQPPTPPPRKSSAPQVPLTLDTKASFTASRPDKPEATIPETATAQAAHPEVLRKQLAAEAVDFESDEAELRPPTVRRKSPAQMPLEMVAVEASSAASPGAAASSGADAAVPPSDVFRVLPKYPPESFAAGEEGVVVLWVRVDDEGVVLATGVRNSSGYPRLDAAAVAAMRQWRFAPATPGDRSRATVFKSSLTFTIPKSK